MFGDGVGPTSVLASKLVVASIYGDPVHPGSQRGMSLELISFPEDSQERLLGGVEGLISIPEHSETDREHPIFVVPHDLVEGLVVASHHLRQKIGVLRCGGHGRNRTSEIADR